MAQIIINIDDIEYPDIRDTLALKYEYPLQITNPAYEQFLIDGVTPNPEYIEGAPEMIANTETKGAFIKRKVIERLKEDYIQQKEQINVQQASIDTRLNDDPSDFIT